MKEVWVKKTIWRRYLIDDADEKETELTLKCDVNGDGIVADCLDKNKSVEYDNEKVVLPIEFKIQEI